MLVRRLTPADAFAFQALRLAALKDSSSAFGSSYEEEKDFPVSAIEARLAAMPDRGVFGAFENEDLVGLAGLGRQSMAKLAHKAFVWGVYVKPEARGKGVARALLIEALCLARSVPGVTHVNLCVNAGNSVAIGLYEALGFKAYGREPGALLVDGKLHDEIQMCLGLEEG